jgi:hypothetical protein
MGNSKKRVSTSNKELADIKKKFKRGAVKSKTERQRLLDLRRVQLSLDFFNIELIKLLKQAYEWLVERGDPIGHNLFPRLTSDAGARLRMRNDLDVLRQEWRSEIQMREQDLVVAT